jgi:hypothetical protein
MRVDLYGMDATNTPDAPRITSAHLRLALATRHGLIGQDLRSGMVIAFPAGLSKTEAMDPELVVLIDNQQARWFVDNVGGSYTDAAKSATAILAWESQVIDARLAAWAAKTAEADK